MLGSTGTLIAYVLLITLTGFVVGLVGIPTFNFLFGRSLPLAMRTAFGRIMWCMAALAVDNARLVRREHGYEFRKVVEDDDGNKKLYLGDDEYLELEDEDYLTRFGLIEFGVTYLPDEYERYDEITVDEELEMQANTAAQADGGIQLLPSTRGGYQEFLPAIDTDNDETLVKVDKAEEPIRNAAGASQANKAEDDALVEHGGAGGTSNKVIAICGLLALVTGAAMGYVVMGM